MSYDPSGSVASIKDPLGRRVTFTHNAAGQLTAVANPLGNTTTYSYTSPAGDLQSITDPLGNTTHYAIDLAHFQVTITPPAGGSIIHYYDGLGHLTGVADGQKSQTKWTFDLMGNVTSITDANGNVTSIAPTSSGDGVSACDALMRCAYSYYDDTGKLASSVDKRGIATSYSYDALDRLTTVDVNSNKLSGYAERVLTYGYDGLNRMTSAADSLTGLTTTRAYDGVDDLISESTPGLNNTISYGYDGDGRRT